MTAIKSMLFVCFLTIISCKNYNSASHYTESKNETGNLQIPKDFYGNYKVKVETESTSTGMASISYEFKINKSGALLNTTTYHEPVRCNGNYKGVMKNGVLELFYKGDDPTCKSEEPHFNIKKVDQKIFTQGLGGESTFNEWIEMSKL